MSLHLLIVTLLAACVVGVIDFGLAQERPAEQLITVLGEIRKIVDGEKFEGNRSKALAEVAEVQARAGLQEEAEKTFGDFVVSLQGRSLGRGQDSTSIKIELLLRMAIAADKAGDHAAAIQYLNRAFVLTKGRIFQRAQLLDFSLILTEEVEFERVLETAFELREQILADKIFVTGNEIVVGLSGDETNKAYAQGTLHLARIAAQLKLGQNIAARASIQSFAVKFADYEDAWPCHHSSRLAPLLAELGDVEKAIEVLDRCFARRNKILKNHPEDDPSHGDTARYRFYEARDLARVARAIWRSGYQSQATQLFENALTLGHTTPFDDQIYYWWQLAGAAAEMGRIDVIEELISKGYRNDDSALPSYPDVLRCLLDAGRFDLIATLSTYEENLEALIHAQVEREDFYGALKTGEGVSGGSDSSPEMIRDLSHAHAAVNGVEEAIKWSARWKKPWTQVSSLLGVAERLISELKSGGTP